MGAALWTSWIFWHVDRSDKLQIYKSIPVIDIICTALPTRSCTAFVSMEPNGTTEASTMTCLTIKLVGILRLEAERRCSRIIDACRICPCERPSPCERPYQHMIIPLWEHQHQPGSHHHLPCVGLWAPSACVNCICVTSHLCVPLCILMCRSHLLVCASTSVHTWLSHSIVRWPGHGSTQRV